MDWSSTTQTVVIPMRIMSELLSLVNFTVAYLLAGRFRVADCRTTRVQHTQKNGLIVGHKLNDLFGSVLAFIKLTSKSTRYVYSSLPDSSSSSSSSSSNALDGTL
jgi:hypothetical protein